jgi:hypothetical protein
MAWHDYLAAMFFLAAATFVARRAYRALSGGAEAGCARGCGSCSQVKPEEPGNLLTIGPRPNDVQR